MSIKISGTRYSNNNFVRDKTDSPVRAVQFSVESTFRGGLHGPGISRIAQMEATSESGLHQKFRELNSPDSPVVWFLSVILSVIFNSLMILSKLSYLIISIFILTTFINSHVSYSESVTPPDSGEITVEIDYGKDTALFSQYTPIVQIYLLSDKDDILSQIENLREQSKAELEPVVKQYMLTAEKLTQLTTKTDAGQTTQQTKKQLSNAFKTIEREIDAVLAYYRTIIDARMQQHTLETFTLPCSVVTRQLKNIAAGKYRLYGVMTFSTTTLRWFEPIVVKGGDRQTVYLARDNIMNPYWTDLNWWGFMNLDFSKHH